MEHDIELTLKDIVEETPDVKSYVFTCTNNDNFTWQPGQYLDWYIKHDNPDDRGEYRWITIASSPSEKNIMLSTRFSTERSSTFKRALSRLNVGDKVMAKGPMGSFTLDNVGRQTVMIAGGIGITPFRAILSDLSSRNQLTNARLIYGNKSDQNVPFKSLLDQIASTNPDFTIDYIYGQIIDAQLINNLIGDLKGTQFMISGLEKMVASIKQSLIDAGVNQESIKTDDFDGYDHNSNQPIFQ